MLSHHGKAEDFETIHAHLLQLRAATEVVVADGLAAQYGSTFQSLTCNQLAERIFEMAALLGCCATLRKHSPAL